MDGGGLCRSGVFTFRKQGYNKRGANISAHKNCWLRVGCVVECWGGVWAGGMMEIALIERKRRDEKRWVKNTV